MFANAYKGRRVFVTGHTGFKGSWLAAWLTQMGAVVGGFSDCVPTTPSHYAAMDLGAHLEADMRGDIRDREGMIKAMRQFQPDVVFHLAAQALVRKSYDDPAMVRAMPAAAISVMRSCSTRTAVTTVTTGTR